MYDMTMFEIELNDFYIQFIGFLLTMLLGLAVKDYAVSFMKGLFFRLFSPFDEGDKVLLEDQTAMIIKIGLNQTVFGVYGDEGYTWRYVPNERIPYLKLEKVVDSELHADSADEKAEKIRKILNKEK
jgi:hypothetical protein|tara:strand:- start:59 stop:439 length:381 start_codon:yes stop_codon:yes gene_type:complete